MERFRKLEKNICDVIREDQIKLGYRSETMRLYYPLESLNRLVGMELDIPEMYGELEDFCEEVEPRFGRVVISNSRERFCLTFPPQTAEYVHDKLPRDQFLEDFIAVIAEHGCTPEDVLAVFSRYSKQVHLEKLSGEEFDYLVYFADGRPNDYRYCLTAEGCHMTYHRFTPEDYEEMGFDAASKAAE